MHILLIPWEKSVVFIVYSNRAVQYQGSSHLRALRIIKLDTDLGACTKRLVLSDDALNRCGGFAVLSLLLVDYSSGVQWLYVHLRR